MAAKASTPVDVFAFLSTDRSVGEKIEPLSSHPYLDHFQFSKLSEDLLDSQARTLQQCRGRVKEFKKGTQIDENSANMVLFPGETSVVAIPNSHPSKTTFTSDDILCLIHHPPTYDPRHPSIMLNSRYDSDERVEGEICCYLDILHRHICPIDGVSAGGLGQKCLFHVKCAERVVYSTVKKEHRIMLDSLPPLPLQPRSYNCTRMHNTYNTQHGTGTIGGTTGARLGPDVHELVDRVVVVFNAKIAPELGLLEVRTNDPAFNSPLEVAFHVLSLLPLDQLMRWSFLSIASPLRLIMALLRFLEKCTLKRPISCCYCDTNWFNPASAFKLPTADGPTMAYLNPGGLTMQLLFIKPEALAGDRRRFVSPYSTPTPSFSWFPGYGWEFLRCPGRCASHIGFKFTRLGLDPNPSPSPRPTAASVHAMATAPDEFYGVFCGAFNATRMCKDQELSQLGIAETEVENDRDPRIATDGLYDSGNDDGDDEDGWLDGPYDSIMDSDYHVVDDEDAFNYDHSSSSDESYDDEADAGGPIIRLA